MSLQQDRILRYRRYAAAIPHAVARYREGPNKPSMSAVAKYELGLKRYARVLLNAARTRTSS